MSGPVVRLFSDGLLSKWGFGAGDIPDHVWDHLDEIGWREWDWHAALRLLVRRHLLPALEQKVEVYDIHTIHNPIRASHVDGQEIDDTADNEDIELTPDHIELAWEQVEAALREVSGGRDDS